MPFSSVVRAAAAMDDEDDSNAITPLNKEERVERQKVHTVTVCLVPAPNYTKVWDALTKARTELKDPGLYRWPPHANLLYPFLDLTKRRTKRSRVMAGENGDGVGDVGSAVLQREEEDETGEEETGGVIDRDIVEGLAKAAEQCDPFHVELSTLGTFGGKKRGVLWLYPRSYRFPKGEEETSNCPSGAPASQLEDKEEDRDRRTDSAFEEEPLYQLQSLLRQSFPLCTEQSSGGKFTPHITLSHYPSLDSASEARKVIESWWTPQRFAVEFIYLLKRVGDDGQFEIVAEVPLGRKAGEEEDVNYGIGGIRVHDPPIPFPAMPRCEEDWVREERMKLKARRNQNSRRRGGRRGGKRRRNKSSVDVGDDPRGPSRSRDSPEVIEAKRKARREKRERMEREVQEIARALGEE